MGSRSKASPSPKPKMSKDDPGSSIQSLSNSYRSSFLKPVETSVQSLPPESVKARQVEAISSNSNRESTEAFSSSSIAELSRQCASVFEACTHHESLMDREWAEGRFIDFNIYIHYIGVLSASRVSLDYRLDSGSSNRFLLHTVLTMLKDFLGECISCAEAQSSIDAATKKVDSSLKYLFLIMEAITQPGMRSCLPQGDIRFKPEEHEELRAFLGIMCLRQYTRNDYGVEVGQEAQHDVSKLEVLSTEECIKVSEGLKLSETQQRLIEVNLRRRNRFLQAQERDREESVGDPTKASTTQDNSRAQETDKKASQPVVMALTALTAAARYPRAPKLPQGATTFKCPCCCQTLPAEFATDNDQWREYLAEDVSPYTCILPDCTTPFATYTTVVEWESHFQDKESTMQYFPTV